MEDMLVPALIEFQAALSEVDGKKEGNKMMADMLNAIITSDVSVRGISNLAQSQVQSLWI